MKSLNFNCLTGHCENSKVNCGVEVKQFLNAIGGAVIKFYQSLLPVDLNFIMFARAAAQCTNMYILVGF